MILGETAINRAFRNGHWHVFTEDGAQEIANVGANSIDLTLSKHFIKDGESFSLDKTVSNDDQQDGSLILWPGELILGCTREAIDCSAPLNLANRVRTFVPMLEGRSTLARMGIVVHLTAGFGDYGFKDAWTLEILNQSKTPYLLSEYMRVAQIYFQEVMEPSFYSGNYKNNFRPKLPVADNL